jgi:hypothetical protein
LSEASILFQPNEDLGNVSRIVYAPMMFTFKWYANEAKCAFHSTGFDSVDGGKLLLKIYVLTKTFGVLDCVPSAVHLELSRIVSTPRTENEIGAFYPGDEILKNDGEWLGGIDVRLRNASKRYAKFAQDRLRRGADKTGELTRNRPRRRFNANRSYLDCLHAFRPGAFFPARGLKIKNHKVSFAVHNYTKQWLYGFFCIPLTQIDLVYDTTRLDSINVL